MLSRLAAPAALLVLLAGCAAAPTPVPSATPVAADVTCRQYSNILTLMANASTAHFEGRFSDQELEGAANLAMAMLADIPAEPDSVFAESLAQLKELPPGELIKHWDRTATSTQWSAPETALSDACAAAGSDFSIMGWTGG